MKALTKPKKFQAMSRIYGYELEWDVDPPAVCVTTGSINVNDEDPDNPKEEIYVCEGTCEPYYDCDVDSDCE